MENFVHISLYLYIDYRYINKIMYIFRVLLSIFAFQSFFPRIYSILHVYAFLAFSINYVKENSRARIINLARQNRERCQSGKRYTKFTIKIKWPLSLVRVIYARKNFSNKHIWINANDALSFFKPFFFLLYIRFPISGGMEHAIVSYVLVLTHNSINNN